MTIDDEKAALRLSAKEVRTTAHEKYGIRADKAIAGHSIGFANPPALAVVSVFLSIRNEIDPLLLMARLTHDGFDTALPVMEGKGKPLVFRAWVQGDPLDVVKWGIKEPPSTARQVIPDVIMVPLLAFDERGFRIGYGGGFYDRSIEKLRQLKPIVTIGLAYDEQRVDAVPREGHDEQLDWVLTPSGPIRCRAT